jgi:UDPglucose--hexose-1-phosphate uridylyltransferase
MPELRHDPIQRRWVIIATERARRPSDFRGISSEEETVEPQFCPFCAGNEEKTPPEIFAIRQPGTFPDTAGWDVRVVMNKFPALRVEGELNRQGIGMFDMMNGIGAHEVIIETPEHHLTIPDMSHDHLIKVISTYKQRLCDLKNDPRLRYVLLFKNYKQAAGASLSHPHSQVIATPVTPLIVAQELESAKDHYLRKERCLFCDVIKQEVFSGQRIIQLSEHFVAIAPFASRFPFEIFLAPLKHAHDFGEMTEAETSTFTRDLRDTLKRLKVSLNDPPYNFVLHTAPNTHTAPRRPGYWETLQYDFHWHLEIIPRLTRMAGFEWGSGFYINPTPPEDAAQWLRDVEV